MHINHAEIYADYIAAGLPVPATDASLADGVVTLKALEVSYTYPARDITERDISRALQEATDTPFAAYSSFMTMLAAAGTAGQIPQHLIDDLDASKDGLDICDADVRTVLVLLQTIYPSQVISIDKLLALNTEWRSKYPQMKTGWIQNAVWKSAAGYGENA